MRDGAETSEEEMIVSDTHEHSAGGAVDCELRTTIH
jgi:hypothetical protein